MKDLRDQLKRVESEVKSLRSELKSAEKFTSDFLTRCAKAGYTKVSIGKLTDEIESSKHWPFGHSGSVFAGPEECRINGWPAIWNVCEQMKISGGAGNSHQHQVYNENLLEGVYELKKGKWLRID